MFDVDVRRTALRVEVREDVLARLLAHSDQISSALKLLVCGAEAFVMVIAVQMLTAVG